MKSPTPDELVNYAARLRLVHQMIQQALTVDGAYAKQFYLEHIAYHMGVDLTSITYERGVAPFQPTKNPSAAGVSQGASTCLQGSL